MNMNMKNDSYLYATPEGFSNLILSVAEGVLTEVSFVKDGAREGRAKAIACHDVSASARAVNGARESGGGEDALSLAVKWLDMYFAGGRPDFLPPYQLRNVTPFRQQVLDLLLAIPYGQTVTYGELAKQLAEENGRASMSAQAVGQAVGWNPIGIMIPCHRVLGAGGRLTGYAGGIANKKALLRLENAGSFEAGLLQP
ncbi:MAG: methylated-DNA--[protein]-cysteine S-methyltransferase [Anaerovibrio sp.]